VRNGVLRARISPYDSPAERLASLSTPGDGCFALIGDS
jgi:hypothetical protein